MQQWQIGKNGPSAEVLEELLRQYPWFAIAHKERFLQSGGAGVRRVSPYLHSVEKVVKDLRRSPKVKEFDEVVLPPVEKERSRDIFVVGGDYFNREEYNEVKDSGVDVFDSFRESVIAAPDVKVKVDKGNDQFMDDEYCTETLAKIYLAQGFYKRALEVYDKLILLYPEKSAYFAALKEEINKQL